MRIIKTKRGSRWHPTKQRWIKEEMKSGRNGKREKRLGGDLDHLEIVVIAEADATVVNDDALEAETVGDHVVGIK